MTCSCSFTQATLSGTYTHSVPPIETTTVIPACEDVDIVLAPSDCGDSEGSSSGSEDSESTSINSDAMDEDESEGDKDAGMDDK